MDEWWNPDWNESLNLISIGKNNDFSFNSFRSTPSDRDEDSQVLEKRMILERKIDGIPIRKVFVSNIPKEVKNNELFFIFKQFGEIVQVFISRKNSNKKTTFGFVTFRKTEDAACALSQKKPLVVRHKRLTVVPADSWHQPLVNPDGSVQFYASFCYNKNKHNAEKNQSDEGDSDDDNVGSVGSIVVTNLSSQEAEQCPISRLNDDCLWHIFSHLPLNTQITASKVCKRWQTVISNMCRSIESLRLRDHFGAEILQVDRLQTVLEYIGPNLKKIVCDLADDFILINNSLISLIARYCKNLEVLEIASVEIPKRGFLFLAKQCPKLRDIHLRACEQLTDTELSYLFGRSNCKLEKISLIQLSEIRGKCFYNLQPPMKSIIIERCISFKPEFLMLGLTKVKDSLTSLELKDCMNSYCYDMHHIANIVPNLKHLNVSDIYPFSSTCPLEALSRFTELQSLDLSNNCLVTDSIIRIIVDSCSQLKTLNLSGRIKCGVISRDGIAELSKLKSLEELNISHLDQVDDESLKLFSVTSPPSHIKKLICCNCEKLGDKGASSILSLYKDLELFDLSGCITVSNETVKKALNIVKRRTNNVQLTIMVYNTCITEDPSCFHRLLKLDFTDNTFNNHIDLIDEFLFPCDNGNDFRAGTACQCCARFNGEYDDEITDSDEEIDEFFVDIDGFEFDIDDFDDYSFLTSNFT
ncbi:putative RNA-binding protein EEED8.10 [Lycorma delicatula]|uniref:putative RNA-binding protein EEED8.10 n=1 Tax=Lycorma delicatula TaxID=130591 RepID=UPI003F50F1BB